MGKHRAPKGQGSVYTARGIHYFRCWAGVSIKDGTPLVGNRTQQSIRLVAQDEDLHRSSTSTAVIMLANDARARIDQWEADAVAGVPVPVVVPETPAADITVTEFYHTRFLPWLESHVATGQKSHATLVSYKRFWDTYLSEHFNHSKTFRNYQPYVGQQFLDELRKDDGTPLGANTLRHIHSTASGIFSRAIRSMQNVTADKDVTALNPWHSIKVGDAPSISAEQGPATTEKEVEIIISNLETERGGRDDWNVQLAQTALAVGIYAGLRPSELAGLKWSSVDIDNAQMTIRRAFVYGKLKEKTKTKRSRIVKYDDKLTGILRCWKATEDKRRAEGGNNEGDWVFPNRDNNPVNMSSLIDRIIAPSCEKTGVQWNDFYSLRRGAISDRVNRRKWTLEEVAEFAGNTSAVIEKHYLIRDFNLSGDARERDRENDLKQRAAAGRQLSTEDKDILLSLGVGDEGGKQ